MPSRLIIFLHISFLNGASHQERLKNPRLDILSTVMVDSVNQTVPRDPALLYGLPTTVLTLN